MKIKNVLSRIRRELASLLKGIPIASYQRIAHILQSASATLFAAGMIGLAVSGDTVTPSEAWLLIAIALVIFLCGTMMDIKAEHKKQLKQPANTR